MYQHGRSFWHGINVLEHIHAPQRHGVGSQQLPQAQVPLLQGYTPKLLMLSRPCLQLLGRRLPRPHRAPGAGAFLYSRGQKLYAIQDGSRSGRGS